MDGEKEGEGKARRKGGGEEGMRGGGEERRTGGSIPNHCDTRGMDLMMSPLYCLCLSCFHLPRQVLQKQINKTSKKERRRG